MQVQELTKKIHDDFPKTWKKIIRYFEKYEEYGIVFGNKSQFCIFMHNDLSELCLIPFSILYGLLENFFEENGIIILLSLGKYFRDDLRKKPFWAFKLTNKIAQYLYARESLKKLENRIPSKQEAKEQAILKACEMLERKLNKEK